MQVSHGGSCALEQLATGFLKGVKMLQTHRPPWSYDWQGKGLSCALGYSIVYIHMNRSIAAGSLDQPSGICWQHGGGTAEPMGLVMQPLLNHTTGNACICVYDALNGTPHGPTLNSPMLHDCSCNVDLPSCADVEAAMGHNSRSCLA